MARYSPAAPARAAVMSAPVVGSTYGRSPAAVTSPPQPATQEILHLSVMRVRYPSFDSFDVPLSSAGHGGDGRRHDPSCLPGLLRLADSLRCANRFAAMLPVLGRGLWVCVCVHVCVCVCVCVVVCYVWWLAWVVSHPRHAGCCGQ